MMTRMTVTTKTGADDSIGVAVTASGVVEDGKEEGGCREQYGCVEPLQAMPPQQRLGGHEANEPHGVLVVRISVHGFVVCVEVMLALVSLLPAGRVVHHQAVDEVVQWLREAIQELVVV